MDKEIIEIVNNWAGWADMRMGIMKGMDRGYIKYAIIEAMKDVSKYQAEQALKDQNP